MDNTVKKKVVVAYSGGLDTSYCVVYLKECGYEVHAVTVNTGGFSIDEIESSRQNALKMGADSFSEINSKQDFYDNCLRYFIAGNVLRNQTYPLSVSAERVFQAKAIAEYARQIDATHIAHGSTGAGNDQIRFDLVFRVLCPEMEIITPIRDQQLSRDDEINYLKANGVNLDWAKAQYSVNKGLWGTSVGGKETLGSWEYLPEEAWPTTVSKTTPEEIVIEFEAGHPVSINEKRFDNAVQLIEALHVRAAPYGIGRGIHVGDTIIGIKGRVGFEAPAPMILLQAHRDLEKHVLTKQQLQLKEQLGVTYGQLVHEGFMLEPAARDIEAFLASTQGRVSGKVRVRLMPYNAVVLGIESKFDLMSSPVAAYGETHSGWSGDEARSFGKLTSTQLKTFYSVGPKNEKH